MSMEREFVSYEQAVALRDLGAGFPYIAWYLPNNPMIIVGPADISTSDIPAPLKSQVFRWFREKYMVFNPQRYISQTMGGRCRLESFEEYDQVDGFFDTYEEAESAAIDKLIELFKQQVNGN